MPNRNIHLARPCYTLDVTGTSAELTLYGEIVESRPVDWRTGAPVDDELIVLSEFLSDLDTIKDVDNLTIRMNSVGGDGTCAIAIHNRLRQLSAKKTCIVDGVAMSGGSLIMCACDHTVVYPSSIVLWHHAWTFVWDALNAPEMRKLAANLDGIDTAQAEIYARKTGKSVDECAAIMDEERYLTGREAVEMGLADELADDGEDLDISVSADKRILFVKGHKLRIAAMGELPDNIKTVETAPGSGRDNKTPETSGKKEEGGESIMPMTLEQLRKENPELAEALFAEAQTSVNAEAVNAERKRIADIDAIASLFDDETVKAAKYGDTACSAQEMAYRAAVNAAAQGKKFMADVLEDAEEGGANNVPSAHASEDEDKPMTNADMLAAGKAAALKAQGKTE